ncbi:hypothetical protein CAOG_04105 [Capsaspora owczarzaki ATCC 30864]|uniref:hypothetical protein n=1 Tax=Capsaspora owczarzaki (strain ATCC 30864) TaxID=595528 RepID=UPI0001FE2ED7|nr:hypothetical protein CAOG_04105 [Capsaspora owczarzaki ATCC 30864]|eukprot:XP_004347930.1 hypothetical protein CAOG_04105 [Capsaspora owczarzaki ATCC 30864]
MAVSTSSAAQLADWLQNTVHYQPPAAAAHPRSTHGTASSASARPAPLQPDAVEWLFGTSSQTDAFLKWLVQTVRPASVLSPEDALVSRQLLANGSRFLTGQALEQALAALQNDEDCEDSVEKLESDIAALTVELAQCKQQVSIASTQRDKLSQLSNQLSSRASHLRQLEVAEAAVLTADMKNCEKLNANMNAVFNDVSQAIHKAVEATSSSSSEIGTTLSSMDCTEYNDFELKYSSAIKQYHSQRFFNGVTEHLCATPASRHELLDRMPPEALLLSPDKPEMSHHQQSETERLEHAIQEAIVAHIQELSNLDASAANAQQLQRALHALSSQASLSADATNARQQLEDKRHRAEQADVLARTLLNEAQAMAAPLAQKHTLPLLLTDCRFKLSRQHYLATNLDTISKLLLAQQARREFLRLSLELDEGTRIHEQGLVRSLVASTELASSQFRQRMTLLSDPLLSNIAANKKTIDESDPTLLRLHGVLSRATAGWRYASLDSTQADVASYAQLVQYGRHLQESTQSTLRRLDARHAQRQQHVDAVTTQIGQLEKVLYQDAATHEIRLTSKDLQSTIEELLHSLDQLAKGMDEVIQRREKYRQALLDDPLLDAQRSLFVHFLLEPEQLLANINQLQQRLASYQARS